MINIARTILLSAVCLLLLLKASLGVPAFSHPEEVKGRVISYSIIRADLLNIKPGDMTLYIIAVEEKGRKLSVFSKDPVPAWVFGKEIEAEVIFRGGPRGGAYWLLKLKEVR